MEIINPLHQPGRDIKPPLRRLEEADNPLEALCGRRLLKLVAWLEDCTGPRVLANVVAGELHLAAGHAGPVVRVGVDWPDYGPLRDGLPVSHYRIRVQKLGAALSDEARTPDAEKASRLIVQALTGLP